ncbi:MAG: NusA antitermination factor [Parcubacteria group bacterium GW2011_GWA1_36_12]|nr:MAG: NusA antitermination factor [Parcubacteria group bacterium GW2011_GWA1_36_12]
MELDIKAFISAIAQIAEEKEIPTEKIIETIESALAVAYKKDYGKKGQIVKAKMNMETGDVKFWQVKIVVDESMIYSEEELEQMSQELDQDERMETREEEEGVAKKVRFNPERHIMLDEAKKINPKIKPGEELESSLESKGNYGRIAAQTAKQVILQKIKEAERETILGEYRSKEGEIVSGIVQRIEGRNIFLDIGKTLGILTKEEQVPGEFYRQGQRLKLFLLKAEESPKGPVIFLSRAYPKLVSKLFELEVPEISAGQVQIRAIAREAGFRSKIAVFSTEESIDPIGSAVGQRGARVTAIISELGGEKIDIIEYSDDPEKFIANSIAPAKVLEVKILPRNKALVIVPDDQLSLAIGRDGQNVRLAAKLTGWKIDVRSAEQAGDIEEEIEEEEAEKEKKEKIEKEEKTTEKKKTKKTTTKKKSEKKKEDKDNKEAIAEK